MKKFGELIKEAKRIGITGHVHPDGDCVGSCLALYLYLQKEFNQDNSKTIRLYLEPFAPEFHIIPAVKEIVYDYPDEEAHDLFFVMDCSSVDRVGQAQKYILNAKKTINIDHHISNTEFTKERVVCPDASSTCEVLYDLLDSDKIDVMIAKMLYLGIVHDTGVFKHSNTTEKTMCIAGKLISIGVLPSQIIDETFYQKTYLQNQILGRCLTESILVLNGKVIVGLVTKKEQDFYGVVPSDLDGIIDQLRVTKGVEVAIFLREDAACEYKVSMRSNGVVDVSKIAVFFGGGGHKKAAGCTMVGQYYDVVNNITAGIEHQLKENN